MNEIFYLEPSEEITGVIDRIRKTSADAVALVIPRGSTIAQSIVNLKLLKKAGDELEKEVSLVATDRIARNLASQIGITVYSKVSEAESGKPKPSKNAEPEVKKPEATGDFKINSYYYKNDEDAEEEVDDIEAIEETGAEEAPGEEEVEEKEVEVAAPGKSAHRVFGKASDEIEPKERAHRELEEDAPKPHPDFAKREVERKPHVPERSDLKSEPPKGQKKMSGSRKILIGIISFAVIAVLVLSYLFIPYATASVAIQTENLDIKEEVRVDRNTKVVDAENLTVPGNMIEVTKQESKDFTPTGKKDVGVKATGTITFSNGTLLDKSLKSGAAVTSGSGVKFILTADVTLPKGQLIVDGNGLPSGVKAGTATGTIEAVSTGDSSNLPASTTYTVSGVSNVTGSGATTGGVSKQITVVSADDLKKAETDIKTQITTDAQTDLSTQAKDAKVTIIESTVQSETVSASSDKNENDEADKFTFTMQIKLFGIGFSEADVRKAVTDSAVKSLSDGKMFVGAEQSEMTYEVSDSSVDEGFVKLNVAMVGKVGQNLSAESIKEKIKNKSVGDAKQAIEAINSVTSANISVSPSFVNRLPVFAKRIKVNFSYSE